MAEREVRVRCEACGGSGVAGQMPNLCRECAGDGWQSAWLLDDPCRLTPLEVAAIAYANASVRGESTGKIEDAYFALHEAIAVAKADRLATQEQPAPSFEDACGRIEQDAKEGENG